MKKMVFAALMAFLVPVRAESPRVEMKQDEVQGKVEILVEGRLFTSYCYGPEYSHKPIFYPLLTASGKMVNRAWPLVEEGESRDHPHQASLWFTYGDVNGLDYWSNSPDIRISHREFSRLAGGEHGELVAHLDWIGPDNNVLLKEIKKVVIGIGRQSVWLDHDSILTAVHGPVTFGDTKEGMFGIRVSDQLRENGGTGRYVNAYGLETSAELWGRRAPWVALWGVLDGENLTLAIFDHPVTENHPSYWHARDYGLFAANSLGRKDYIGGNVDPVIRTLEPGASFEFRYRVVLYSGKQSKKSLDEDYWEYIR